MYDTQVSNKLGYLPKHTLHSCDYESDDQGAEKGHQINTRDYLMNIAETKVESGLPTINSEDVG
jgi:hypothetical protein